MKISPFYTIGTFFFFLSFTHLCILDGYIFTDVQSEKVHTTMSHGEESQVTVRLFLERKKRENHKFRYGVREPMPLCPVTREIEFRRNVRLGKIEC